MMLIYVVIDVGDVVVCKQIVVLFICFNESQVGLVDFWLLVVIVIDEVGVVVGGLWGGMVFGWLYVDLLVVFEVVCGQGVGMCIMDLVEQEVVVCGCYSVWFDMFDFQV